MQFRDAGDQQSALKHLQAMKKLQKDLDEHLLMNPGADQPPQQPVVAKAQPKVMAEGPA